MTNYVLNELFDSVNIVLLGKKRVKPKTGISEIVQTKVEVSLALLLKEEHLHSTIS